MRLIVIGDVHGCWQELHDLLDALSPEEDDVVASVGDFLTKGPEPERCLDLWRESGWHAVLGNNDQAVLRVLGGESCDPKHENDARRLEQRVELVEYLEQLPLVLDYASLDTAVVHGGVLPHSSFADGVDPKELLTLRDVVEVGDEWRPALDEDPDDSRHFWADVWQGDRFIVYGHTPRQAATWHPRAVGIDTGCVYGWCLTAAIRSERGEWRATSVPALHEWEKR